MDAALYPFYPDIYSPAHSRPISTLASSHTMNILPNTHAHPNPFRNDSAPCSDTPMCHAYVPSEIDWSAPEQTTTRFATSDERSAPRGSARRAPAAAPAASLHPTAPPAHSGLDLASLCPPTHEIALGVLSDGAKTARHPAVRAFLHAPSAEAAARQDRDMRALCALCVLHRPAHPAHLLFWGRDEKQRTAELVQDVLGA